MPQSVEAAPRLVFISSATALEHLGQVWAVRSDNDIYNHVIEFCGSGVVGLIWRWILDGKYELDTQLGFLTPKLQLPSRSPHLCRT